MIKSCHKDTQRKTTKVHKGLCVSLRILCGKKIK